jgi:CRP-like cAMP-binding protein
MSTTMLDSKQRRISRELFLAGAVGNLGTLEPWVTDRLIAILDEEEAAAGDRLFAAGEPAEHVYFVKQGTVELALHGGTIEVVEGPRTLGMSDVLIERPHSASAHARTPVELLKVRTEAWIDLLEDSFPLARSAVLSLVRAVAGLETQQWANGRFPLAVPSPAAFAGKPLDLVERLMVLMQTPLLRRAGVQPLSDLASACEEISFAPSDLLFGRGVPRERILVLVEGRVEASRENPQASWRGGPGQVVCGTVSFADTDAAWHARATSQGRALAFGLDDWFDVMEENFEMVRTTLGELALQRERLAGVVSDPASRR